VELVEPLFADAFAMEHRGSIRIVLGRFTIPQSGHGDVASLAGGFRFICGETFTSSPLLRFDICEQGIGLVEIARFDCLLGVGLESRDPWIVTRLGYGRLLKVLKALGNLKELGSQPLRRHVGVAENVQCGNYLTLI
jgi:hypothetical protein